MRKQGIKIIITEFKILSIPPNRIPAESAGLFYLKDLMVLKKHFCKIMRYALCVMRDNIQLLFQGK